MKIYLIVHAENLPDVIQGQYWNIALGWVDIEQATLFLKPEIDAIDSPWEDFKWLKFSLDV